MKKPIPYGLSDFKEVISNYYYADKTSFIPKLEKYGNFLYLIRPRRFGKSLFLNMLDFYYNVKYEKDFDLLKDTYIYKNPTSLKNSFHILRFDFSAVSTKGDADKNFSEECNLTMKKFIKDYNIDVTIDDTKPAHANLKHLFFNLDKNINIYILIDEYDNFMNNLLVNDKKNYDRLVSSTEAVYKEFFKLLKALTNENNSLLKKMFFTGVSPLALFDVTSGSNIGKNITNIGIFNDIVGITNQEFKNLITYYNLNMDNEQLHNWYDNYKFSSSATHTIFNTDMILYYIDSLILTNNPPTNMIDINVRTDYSKLKYLVHTNNRLNGNFNVLKKLFSDGYISVSEIKDSFSSYELTKQENFISLLYYLGLVTIKEIEMGDIILSIPNETIKTIMAEFVKAMLEETDALEIDLSEFHNLVKYLAYKDSLEVFYYVAKKLDESTSIRDLITQESDIKMFYLAYFSLNRLYGAISEIELNKGYADIFLLKAPNIEFDIPNILIEFKFFKQSDKVLNIQEAIKEAKEQIDRYKQTTKFRVDKSVIVIFHGFKVVYCEWEK